MKKYKVSKEIIKGKCLHLDDLGRGVIKTKFEIPVEGLLPNEKATIESVRNGKFFHTKILKIENESKDRTQPNCEYYQTCGGCQIMHMTYPAQLKYKEELVRRLLGKSDQIIGMDSPYHYRNKIQYSFDEVGKKIITGFYKPYSHDIVSIDHCVVQDLVVDPIVETIRKLVKKFKYRIYNEDTQNGFLRHLFIRTGFYSKEVMVVLVVAKKAFPSKKDFVKALTSEHPEITTIVQNVNDRNTSQVLGEQEFTLFGSGTIKDQLMGLDFNMSVKSFYQINPVQTEKLYGKAIELAAIKADDVIIDAYSGIGTISLLAAKNAKEVYGIELNKSSIKNAIKNARQNNIKNVRFIEGDAGQIMIEMSQEDYPVDVVFMDPPREGSDEAFLNSVMKLKPKRLVYISCNPVTLERDLKLLKKKYKVEKVVPVDMFPHTNHVETIVKLKLLIK